MATTRKLLAAVFALASCETLALAGWQISKFDLTRTTMSALEIRLRMYAAKTHRTPDALKDVPFRPEIGDDTIDGWQTPMTYERHKDGSISIRSVADGKHTRTKRFYILDSESADDANRRSFTDSYVEHDEELVHQFATEHHRLPTSLAELPEVGLGHIDRYEVDGWNQSLHYTVEANGTVTIDSDGSPNAASKSSLNFGVPEAASPTTRPHGPTSRK